MASSRIKLSVLTESSGLSFTLALNAAVLMTLRMSFKDAIRPRLFRRLQRGRERRGQAVTFGRNAKAAPLRDAAG